MTHKAQRIHILPFGHEPCVHAAMVMEVIGTCCAPRTCNAESISSLQHGTGCGLTGYKSQSQTHPAMPHENQSKGTPCHAPASGLA